MLASVQPGQLGIETDFRQRLTHLLTAFAGGGQRRILIIGPIPQMRAADPFTCIDLALTLKTSPERCGQPRAEADALRDRTMEILRETAANLPSARVIDPTDIFCDARICLPVHNGAMTYMDSGHLNDYGAALLYDRFRADFEWAFRG
jgi:hypothetical protein